RHIADRPTIGMARANPNADARQPGDRGDPADQLRRPEDPFRARKARGKIGDADAAAVAILEFGLQNSGVAGITRLRFDLVGEDDIAEPFLLVTREQAAEDRVGVEPRKAPPDDAPGAVDQRRDPAIADEREIERL